VNEGHTTARWQRDGQTGAWGIYAELPKKGRMGWRHVRNAGNDPAIMTLLGPPPAGPTAPGEAVDVAYEMKGGQYRIWPVGAERPRSASKPFDAAEVHDDCFLNPYAFVPARRPPADVPDGPFADHDAYSRAARATDLYSGRIVAGLETVTPLLVLDDARSRGEVVDGKVHRTYGVRRDARGLPLLPVTALKGAVRSIVEAITESRFGVWSTEWDQPLAFREAARDGAAALVPVEIVDLDGKLGARVYAGDTAGEADGALAAAWLPAYLGGRSATLNGRPPRHGVRLWARIRLLQHSRYDAKAKRFKDDFKLWRVESLAETKAGLSTAAVVAVSGEGSRSKYSDLGVTKDVEGVVIWTNQSIQSKHDERFAFGATHRVIDVTPEAKSFYLSVIAAYRRAREHDPVPPDGPARLRFARHQYDQTLQSVSPGLLAFARIEADRVTELRPVHIGRQPWKVSPRELADGADLLPATGAHELSAADRMFGWVNGVKGDSADAARRGAVRIHSIRPVEGLCAIAPLPQPAVLNVLGTPKPTQGRFYASPATNGGPHADNGERDPNDRKWNPASPKQELYGSDGGLRGRKFYWHHAGVPSSPSHADYWADHGHGVEVSSTSKWFREYVRGDGARSDQNRSINEWVPPGSKFVADVRFENLSSEELGALCWALSVPHLRLGYGKPLGFGSVRVNIDQASSEVWTGGDNAAPGGRWMSLQPGPTDPSAVINAATEAFEVAADADNLKRLRRILSGDPRLRVHYPRCAMGATGTPPPPNPEGKNYEWFVENEKANGVALPDAIGDGGGGRSNEARGALPYY
jgi:CRISPR-associated protein (TIGR03986 family)